MRRMWTAATRGTTAAPRFVRRMSTSSSSETTSGAMSAFSMPSDQALGPRAAMPRTMSRSTAALASHAALVSSTSSRTVSPATLRTTLAEHQPVAVACLTRSRSRPSSSVAASTTMHRCPAAMWPHCSDSSGAAVIPSRSGVASL